MYRISPIVRALDPLLTTAYYLIILKQHLLLQCLNFGSKKFWRHIFFWLVTEKTYLMVKFLVSEFVFWYFYVLFMFITWTLKKNFCIPWCQTLSTLRQLIFQNKSVRRHFSIKKCIILKSVNWFEINLEIIYNDANISFYY